MVTYSYNPSTQGGGLRLEDQGPTVRSSLTPYLTKTKV